MGKRGRRYLKGWRSWFGFGGAVETAPGPDSGGDSVDEGLAMAFELVAAARVTDALRLLGRLAERFPDAWRQVREAHTTISLLTGRMGGVLRELGREDQARGPADPARRRRLLGVLRDGAVDLREVAESDELPEEHPLRREAAAAAEAFAAATRGDGAAATAVRSVPRGSPFAPWVLAARAIDAAFRGDRDAVERITRAIRQSSPPARLGPVLHFLVGAETEEALSPAGRRLLAALRGPGATVADTLRQLEAAIRDRDRRVVRRLVDRLDREIEQLAPSLRPEFRRLLFRSCGEQGLAAIERVLPPGRIPEAEFHRCAALALEEREDHRAAREAWDAYLAARGDDAGSEERALVALRQAELSPPGSETIDRLEAAVRAHPGARTFGPLVAHLAVTDPKAAEAAALRWHEARPAAIEPLLHLLAAAERRGAVRKALRFLEAASTIDPGRPEVREGRFRLLLAGAVHRIRTGRLRLAAEDVAAIRATPRGRDPACRPLLLGLDWLVAEGGTARGPLRAELESEMGEEGAACFLHALVARARPRHVEVAAPEVSPEPSRAAAALARTAAIFRSLGWRLPVDRRRAGALREALAAGFEPGEADLEPLCALLGDWRRHGVLHDLAGLGLTRPGARRHRFLLHRARSLVRRKHGDERRRRCLRAALGLARRANDADTEAEALAELARADRPEDAAAPLSAEELDEILAFETAARPRVARGIGGA